MSKRVLVCGGRHFDDREMMTAALREFEPTYSTTGYGEAIRRPAEFVLGGAPGADSLAAAWCQIHGVFFEVFRPDWDKHGRAAGPIRNAKMLAEGKPDLVIAFPGGRGTADMVRKARAAGVEVREIPVPTPTTAAHGDEA